MSNVFHVLLCFDWILEEIQSRSKYIGTKIFSKKISLMNCFDMSVTIEFHIESFVTKVTSVKLLFGMATYMYLHLGFVLPNYSTVRTSVMMTSSDADWLILQEIQQKTTNQNSVFDHHKNSYVHKKKANYISNTYFSF